MKMKGQREKKTGERCVMRGRGGIDGQILGKKSRRKAEDTVTLRNVKRYFVTY